MSKLAHSNDETMAIIERNAANREDEGRAEPAPETEPVKAGYVGAPAIFALGQALSHVNAAFPNGFGCYQVGSSLERANWRDVDVRLILPDDDFDREFPDTRESNSWEFDPKWVLLITSISGWLKAQTGLPVDFQIQPQTHANERHKKRRNAIGLIGLYSKKATP